MLVALNLLVKPLWIFGVDRKVQVLAGYEAYGHYFAYLSFTLIFNILADAGITLFVQQQLAVRRAEHRDWLRQAVLYKLLLSGFYAAVVLGLGTLLGLSDTRLLAGLTLLQLLLSWISFLRAVLSSRQQFGYSSLLSVLDKLLLLAPALGLFYLLQPGAPFTIYQFTHWQVLAATAAVVAGTGLLIYLKPAARGDTPPSSIGQIISGSLPFAAVIFMMFLHSRADGVLLNLLPGHPTQAGQYAAMYRFVDAATVLSYLAAGFLLSFWSRHLQQPEVIRETVDKIFRMMLAAAVLVGVVFFFHSSFLQELLYHRQDPAAARVLQWGMLVLVPAFLIDIFGTLLTANRRLRTYLWIAAAAVVLNLSLNLVFIPRYHALGAAVVALFTQSFMATALLLVCIRRWQLQPRRASVVRLLLLTGVLITTGGLLQLSNLHSWWQLVLLGVVWCLALPLLGLFSPAWFVRWQEQN